MNGPSSDVGRGPSLTHLGLGAGIRFMGAGLRLRPIVYHFSLVEFGAAIDAGRAMGHPATTTQSIPLFNGLRDREIAQTFLAALADCWVGHF